MARYSPERKEAILKKMAPPHNMNVAELASQEGISTATLYNWRKAARVRGAVLPSNSAKPDQWSSEEAPGIDEPFDLVADKGYHSREVLKSLPDCCRSRISEPKAKGHLRWYGDIKARAAVYGNRTRLKSCKGKALLRARGEKVERSFALCLDRGGMRRSFLRGIENIEKRYIIHVAGFNLGVLLRALFGLGTPKGLADAPAWLIFARIGELGLLILVIWVPNATEQPDYPIIVCIGWQI